MFSHWMASYQNHCKVDDIDRLFKSQRSWCSWFCCKSEDDTKLNWRASLRVLHHYEQVITVTSIAYGMSLGWEAPWSTRLDMFGPIPTGGHTQADWACCWHLIAWCEVKTSQWRMQHEARIQGHCDRPLGCFNWPVLLCMMICHMICHDVLLHDTPYDMP